MNSTQKLDSVFASMNEVCMQLHQASGSARPQRYLDKIQTIDIDERFKLSMEIKMSGSKQEMFFHVLNRSDDTPLIFGSKDLSVMNLQCWNPAASERRRHASLRPSQLAAALDALGVEAALARASAKWERETSPKEFSNLLDFISGTMPSTQPVEPEPERPRRVPGTKQGAS